MVRTHAGGAEYASWSPDGRRLAFHCFLGDNVELYTIDAEGTRPRRLTRRPGEDGYPAWSPDGSRIAFASDRGRRGRHYQVYVMSADGSAPRQITRGSASHFTPAWQPAP